MTSTARILVAATTVALLSMITGRAQSDGFDKEAVALVYHKLSADPLDLNKVAAESEAAQRASSFDRPDAVKAEVVRLQALLAAANPGREFTIRVSDSISDYDHDRGEFSIMLFRPGYIVPVDAFGQQYQLIFVNAERARPIPMPKDQAREFDARLSATGRQVTNEIHFRVTGKGDPSGAVTGARVIRAEMLSARLLGPSGAVVFTPNVVPAPAVPATSGNGLDMTHLDAAGLRVGVQARDLDATLSRLFGRTTRRPINKGVDSRLVAALTVNEMGCISLPDGRHDPQPGVVCITASLDGDNVVRALRIERVFAWFDAEVFRKALIQKYGAVASAASVGGDLALGWGAEIDPALAYSQSGPRNALTAHYAPNETFMTRGTNSVPRITVVLSLVDPSWAASRVARSRD